MVSGPASDPVGVGDRDRLKWAPSEVINAVGRTGRSTTTVDGSYTEGGSDKQRLTWR